ACSGGEGGLRKEALGRGGREKERKEGGRE
ncbi:hypothetical protein L345_18504, partial [Ophiophagus hannah]